MRMRDADTLQAERGSELKGMTETGSGRGEGGIKMEELRRMRKFRKKENLKEESGAGSPCIPADFKRKK